MSVNHCVIVVYGFGFDFITYNEKYADLFEEHGLDYYVTEDVMCGEYCVIGVPLARIEHKDNDFVRSNSIDQIFIDTNEFIEEMEEKIPEFYKNEKLDTREFKFYTISHFY